MSCYHRHGHGCDWPVLPPEWYDAYGYRPRRYRDETIVVGDDDCYDEERPRRRRGTGRGRRCRDESTSSAETSAASLQERAASLREQLAMVEEDLAELNEEPGPRPVD